MENSLELMEEINPYLSANEKVLWIDKPEKRFIIAGAEIFNVLFGIFWFAFAAFWLIVTLVSPDASPVMPFFSIPFFLVGIWLILGKHIVEAIKRKRIIYVITNRRVLIATVKKDDGFVEEIKYSDISYVEMKEIKDDIGSIFFFSTPKDPKKKLLSSTGLLGIKNLKSAYEILQERLEKK